MGTIGVGCYFFRLFLLGKITTTQTTILTPGLVLFFLVSVQCRLWSPPPPYNLVGMQNTISLWCQHDWCLTLILFVLFRKYPDWMFDLRHKNNKIR